MSSAAAASTSALPDDHVRVTYEDVHVAIAETSAEIRDQFVSPRGGDDEESTNTELID